jgi:hypothetical protein
MSLFAFELFDHLRNSNGPIFVPPCDVQLGRVVWGALADVLGLKATLAVLCFAMASAVGSVSAVHVAPGYGGRYGAFMAWISAVKAVDAGCVSQGNGPS